MTGFLFEFNLSILSLGVSPMKLIFLLLLLLLLRRVHLGYIGVVRIDVVMRVHVLGQLGSSCSYCIYTDPIIMVLGNGISKFHLCLIVRSYTFPIFY